MTTLGMNSVTQQHYTTQHTTQPASQLISTLIIEQENVPFHQVHHKLAMLNVKLNSEYTKKILEHIIQHYTK